MADDTAPVRVTHRDIRTSDDLYVGGTASLAGRTLTGTPLMCQRGTMSVSEGTAAGTYTVNYTLPAGATLVDIIVHAVALWDAGTSATLVVGDASDADGYFTGVNLKATDLLAGQSICFTGHGGKAGAYIVGTLPTGHWEARYNASARTISAVLTTVGTASTTGETVIEVLYTLPSDDYTSASTYVAT